MTFAASAPTPTPTPTATTTTANLPDSSMVNTPVSEAAVFQECWTLVQATLEHCLQKEPAETKTWFDANRYIATYTAVYKYCVAPRIKEPGEREVLFHGELLYKKLDDALTAMFRVLGNSIAAHDDAGVVQEYVKCWDRVVVLAKHVEAVFMYVERHWVERQLQQAGRSRGATLQVQRIKQLVWSKWDAGVLKKCTARLVAALNARLAMERAAHSLNFCEHTKRLVWSFCLLSADITSMATQRSEPSQVQVYQEVLEPAYLHSLAEHLKGCRAGIVDLDQMRAVWDEEFARASFYLPERSLDKVKLATRDHLVLPSVGLIDSVFTAALCEGDSVRCLEVFGLMELQADLLGHLDETFGRYVTDQLVRLPDSSTEAFIAAILALHRLVTDFVHESLKDRASMLHSRDAAFRNFLGQHQGGQVLARLAVTINHLIRDERLAETEFRSQVGGVMAVFRLLDDKETFLEHHAKLLAHRLLGSSTADLDKEHFVVDKLSAVCGAALTNSLGKMLADVKAAPDATKAYWVGNRTARPGPDGSFTVVTSNNWPLSALPCDFVWPEELREHVHSFSKHFSAHSKRQKLNWLPHVSRIEIAACGFGDNKACTLVMSVLQYAILRPLLLPAGEVTAFLPADTLCRESQLPPSMVSEELSALASKRFLATKVGAGGRIGYGINAAFVPSSECVHLNDMFMDDDAGGAIAVPKAAGVHPQAKSEDEKKLLLNAAIVNVAKKQTQLSLASLISEVQKRVQPWIPSCPVEGVMSSVEHCIEKEYLRRVTPDTIQYVP